MRAVLFAVCVLTRARAGVSVTHMLLKLVAIQTREHLTDGQMAEKIGLSRPTWNRVKNGRLALTDEVAVRAAGLWPELTRDLLDRAHATVSERTNTAEKAGAA